MKRKINLQKSIYEVNDATNTLDLEFSELKVKKYTVKEFFKLYNRIFYNISKTGTIPSNMKNFEKKPKFDENGIATFSSFSGPKGEDPTEGFYITDTKSEPNRNFWISSINTHKEILDKSSEYAGIDESDIMKEIEQLQLLIAKVNQQIEEIPKEHPVFPNGTILESPNGDKHYLVDAKTRKINSGAVWSSLRLSAGLNKDEPNDKLVIKISIEGFEAIGEHADGPINRIEDLY